MDFKLWAAELELYILLPNKYSYSEIYLGLRQQEEEKIVQLGEFFFSF